MNTIYIKSKLGKIEENKIYIEYDDRYDEYNEYNQINIMKKIYDLFNCYK
jgi:hypothetical protein